MIIKSIKNIKDVTKVTIQYVGNRERTFLIDQKGLSEFNKSRHYHIGEFIAEKYGTDFPTDEKMKQINRQGSLILNGGNV